MVSIVRKVPKWPRIDFKVHPQQGVILNRMCSKLAIYLDGIVLFETFEWWESSASSSLSSKGTCTVVLAATFLLSFIAKTGFMILSSSLDSSSNLSPSHPLNKVFPRHITYWTDVYRSLFWNVLQKFSCIKSIVYSNNLVANCPDKIVTWLTDEL